MIVYSKSWRSSERANSKESLETTDLAVVVLSWFLMWRETTSTQPSQAYVQSSLVLNSPIPCWFFFFYRSYCQFSYLLYSKEKAYCISIRPDLLWSVLSNLAKSALVSPFSFIYFHYCTFSSSSFDSPDRAFIFAIVTWCTEPGIIPHGTDHKNNEDSLCSQGFSSFSLLSLHRWENTQHNHDVHQKRKDG